MRTIEKIGSETYNDVLDMYACQGLTTREIADKLDIAEAVVVDVLVEQHYIKD